MSTTKKAKETDTPVWTAEKLAKLLMISRVTVYDLAERGVFVNNNGVFDFIHSIQSYINYLKSKNTARGTGQLDFNAEKARLTKAQADIAEVNLAKVRGNVVGVEQVERNLANVFAEVRANMRNIPTRVSAQLVGEADERVIRKKILEEIDIVLEAIAETRAVIEATEDASDDAAGSDDSEDDGEV